MENQKFKQIIDVVEALHEELSPMYVELEGLASNLKEVDKGDKNLNALDELIVRLTKTSRRHDLDKSVNLKRKDTIVGTNHLGLGIQEEHCSQLTPLADKHRWSRNAEYKQFLRDVLFDEDAVIELTSIIKKSNQKTFLNVIKILKKYKIVEAFEYFKEKIVSEIEVPIKNTSGKIVININSYGIDFTIKNEENRKVGRGEITMRLSEDGKIKPMSNRYPQDDIFNEITPIINRDFSLIDIKAFFLISQHSDEIIKIIKEKSTLLKNSLIKYREEEKELNNLLEPFLALEKL